MPQAYTELSSGSLSHLIWSFCMSFLLIDELCFSSGAFPQYTKTVFLWQGFNEAPWRPLEQHKAHKHHNNP